MEKRRDKKGRFLPGNKEGKRFTAEYQPARNGRKPSIYKQFSKNVVKKGGQLGKTEFLEILCFLVERTLVELKRIKESKKSPVWIVNFVTALLTDVRYGRITTLSYILDHRFGAATSANEINLNQNNIVIGRHLDPNQIEEAFSVLTPEENAALDSIFDKVILKLENGRSHRSRSGINRLK